MSACCVCGRIADQPNSFHCVVGDDIYHYCNIHEYVGRNAQKKGEKNLNKLEDLKNAKTIEQKTTLAIEELYDIVENIDDIDKNMIKRILLYIVALLQGVFD